jgi:hypothetical protein
MAFAPRLVQPRLESAPVVRGEAAAEKVKRRVVEWQLLGWCGVGLDIFEPLFARCCSDGRQHRRGQIARHHIAGVPRQSVRDMPAARTKIQRIPWRRPSDNLLQQVEILPRSMNGAVHIGVGARAELAFYMGMVRFRHDLISLGISDNGKIN